MVSTKSLVYCLLGLNLLVLSFLVLHEAYNYKAASSRIMSIQNITKPANISYHFDNPELALFLLEKLDIYSVVPEEAYPNNNYSRLFSVYQGNTDYCDRQREHFVRNTDSFFGKLKFGSNYWPTHKVRTRVFPQMGEDVTIRKFKIKNKDGLDQFHHTHPYDTQIYFMWNLYFIDRQIGKQYSCLAQSSNHIPGHDLVYRKDMASQALVKYAKRYESRPDCFNFNKYFPKTWVLTEKDQCEEFFAEFLSSRYEQLKQERNVVYFRKIGADVHEGKGVFPVNDAEGEYIRTLYKNGRLCGKIKDNNLIQYNVHNLLLVNNRKFGFRSFMLIASVNPLIAYYHDGYARLSLDTYDSKSNNTSTFVTNIGVNLKHTDYSNWTNAMIQEYTYWPLEKFAGYLYENGIVSDPEWLDNHLRKEFMKVKIHLLRMAQSGFIKKSSVFELFGLDYVMDENLNLWFIEANSMPLLNGFTKHSTQMMNQMLADSFEIVSGLLRSRMKRVILYVNKLVATYGAIVPDLMERREEFRELIKNQFEPEFVPSVNNTFYRIIDENYFGKERYSNLIEQECLAL